MFKKGFLSLLLTVAFSLIAASAMAATSVSWSSPANGSNYPVGTLVAPTGQASGVGQTGNGLDLALVIDESGSMRGSRLATAKSAAISLVNALPVDTSSVTVIGFDHNSQTYITLTALNPNKAAVIAAINSITAGGNTNIAAGILAANAELAANHTAGRAMMEVVLSDGYPNSGNHLAAATAAAAAGITVHTVGIPGHNSTVMQAIATNGGGMYTSSDLAGLVALFNGTGGSLVGLDHVDIQLADGSWINDIATDGLGNFILPAQVIALGANTFTAYAYGTDGTNASALLTLNGTNNEVP